MLALLARCRVASRDCDRAVIIKEGGQEGYEVIDSGILGDPQMMYHEFVWIWTAYNRDGVPTTFAFKTDRDRWAAICVACTQGFGPTKAAAMLHTHGFDHLCQLVRAGDAKAIAAGVKGVSAKSAAVAMEQIASHFGLTADQRLEPAKRALQSVVGNVDADALERIAAENPAGDVSALVNLYIENIRIE